MLKNYLVYLRFDNYRIICDMSLTCLPLMKNGSNFRGVRSHCGNFKLLSNNNNFNSADRRRSRQLLTE